MQRMRKRMLRTMLAVVMATTMIVALPAKAFASSPVPATGDTIALIGGIVIVAALLLGGVGFFVWSRRKSAGKALEAAAADATEDVIEETIGDTPSDDASENTPE